MQRLACSGLLAITTLATAALLTSPPLLAASPSAYQPNYQQGQAWLEYRLANETPGTRARNLILFLGDGMSVTTLTAARIFQGQQQGFSGEENFLSFERFPYSGLVKTYNTNQQTPDSAGTMSAIMTGVKTRAGVLSIGPEQDRAVCQGSQAHQLTTLLEYASQQGLATGVVTTARLTHATPAATYAHTPERDWEADSDLSEEARQQGCEDIAAQLIHRGFANGLDLAMGGGRKNFMTTAREGVRLDTDLTQQFSTRYPDGQLLLSRNDLMGMQARTPVLGLFADSHMAYAHDRTSAEPSLTEMTFAALQILHQQTQNSDRGYVLIIEGARIDHAHHAGNAYRALTDTVAMADAVAFADRMTNDNDTLIMVTADHSHTLSFSGYPQRGNDILGLVQHNDQLTHASDGAPYTTLGYANGLGANDIDPVSAAESGRQNGRVHWHEDEDTSHPDFHQAALGHRESETHGSDDVAIHAKGPGSQWFRGLLEQNSLFHLASRALHLTTQAPAVTEDN
ncbi:MULTISPECIES: alkaline phosphatase [unclassified Oceanobacter]|uniref:alkaline phosphatase n=1 Tax=unclassified Oceanobacter TaxID=2620260 RepID=UPI0027367717|nr:MULTISPECIES: alkaline phosphatase [unclassified Oceanobacter]MDP2506591.1 alkaline phosphatase [Oceanobacter sp. 3_MG-2023]MDP2548962.1 alkaline phosphatase [Oceanobacter sp. 4_MG-2023]